MAYVETVIYIPSSSRCCTSHLRPVRFFKKEALNDLKELSDSVTMKSMNTTVVRTPQNGKEKFYFLKILNANQNC